MSEIYWGDRVLTPYGEAVTLNYLPDGRWVCDDGETYREEELEKLEDTHAEVREH